ncbi:MULTISPECIES: hypothetical protein [Alistipes]|uniref:hypothetical protein n=1 Tax=Alistipes TaxID=239759 RepID=UPI001B3A70D6|nr:MULTISPECIES: hypothetical protein [Alistipes]MBQ4904146.1 hypothetical protein [Alistipes sp. Marseille-P2263]MCI2258251.1 hypothetical protein [Alistipes dispar]
MKKSYLSGLRVLTWAMLLAAGSFVSCSDDNEGKDGPTPPPDPVELNDQFEYDGGDPVDIKSAIYEVEDTDLYTFYLSPSNGVTGMDDMTAVNDFLRIAVRNPKGTVNTETDEFEIAYKDIAVNRNTLKTDVEKVSLQADLVAETSKLNLHVEVTMKSGKTLLARYNNTCTEAVPAELTNQYELDKTVTGIGSAVEWHAAAAAATTYCFYADPDVTAPSEETAGLQITVADGVETAEVDLATADAEKIRIACGEFESGEGMTGTLSLAKSGSKLTLTLDAEKGASRLRAAYAGDPVVGYASTNSLTVTEGETHETNDLKKVFLYQSAATNVLTFGQVADAEAPDGLTKGHYAVSFNLSTSQLQGATVDFGKQEAQVRIFDYRAYRTWDNAKVEGATGTVTTIQAGERTYLRFSVEFPEGPKLEGEWFGTFTTVKEETDMTPVEPFRPRVSIKSETGETLLDWEVTALELRHDTNFRDSNTGDMIDAAYIFYFRTDKTEDNFGIDGLIGTPMFRLPDAYVGRDNFDLTEDTECKWAFNFNNSNLSRYSTGYGCNNSWMKQCPNEATLTVKKNDKEWEFTFTMLDYGMFGYTEQGTKNVLTIEWKGPATKYTGSQKNDMTDADY